MFGKETGIYGKTWAAAYAHMCNLSYSEEKDNLNKHIKNKYSNPSPDDVQ